VCASKDDQAAEVLSNPKAPAAATATKTRFAFISISRCFRTTHNMGTVMEGRRIDRSQKIAIRGASFGGPPRALATMSGRVSRRGVAHQLGKTVHVSQAAHEDADPQPEHSSQFVPDVGARVLKSADHKACAQAGIGKAAGLLKCSFARKPVTFRKSAAPF
jgi:hypothetical protein